MIEKCLQTDTIVACVLLDKVRIMFKNTTMGVVLPEHTGGLLCHILFPTEKKRASVSIIQLNVKTLKL